MLPTDIYLLKVNYRNTRTRCKICSKSVVLVFLFLTLNRFHTLIKCFHYWFWKGKFPFCVYLCFRFHHHHLHSHILPQRIPTPPFSSSSAPKSFTINSWMFSGNESATQSMLPSLFHSQSLRRGSDTLDHVARFIM